MAKKKAQVPQGKTEEEMVPDVSAVEPAVPPPEPCSLEDVATWGRWAPYYKTWYFVGSVETAAHAFQVLEDSADTSHVLVFRREILEDGQLGLPELIATGADGYLAISKLALKIHASLGREKGTPTFCPRLAAGGFQDREGGLSCGLAGVAPAPKAKSPPVEIIPPALLAVARRVLLSR